MNARLAGLFLGHFERSKLSLSLTLLPNVRKPDLLRLDLIAVGLGHGDAEPAGRRGPLYGGAFDQDVLVEADLSNLSSDVYATVLRLQIDVEGFCSHVSGHL